MRTHPHRLVDTTHRARVALGAVALGLFALGHVAPARAQPAAPPDPAFDGASPNLWIYLPGRDAPISVRAGDAPAPTTNTVGVGFGVVTVAFDGGGTETFPQPAGALAITPQRVNGAWPATAALTGGPELRLFGWGQPHYAAVAGALENPGGGPATPGVELDPGPGTYTSLTQIRWEAYALEPVLGVTIALSQGGSVYYTSTTASGTTPHLRVGTSALAWEVTTAGGTFQGTALYDVQIPLAVGGNWIDSDGDGLPDVVELAYGGDPSAQDVHEDTDGDGVSDIDEWVRGSDPRAAASKPLDGDGDGWFDIDEQLRRTSATDDECFPAASSIDDPEVVFAPGMTILGSHPTHLAGRLPVTLPGAPPVQVRAMGRGMLFSTLAGIALDGRRRGDGCEPTIDLAPCVPVGSGDAACPNMLDLAAIGAEKVRVSAGEPWIMRQSGVPSAADGAGFTSANWAAKALYPASRSVSVANLIAWLDPSAVETAEEVRAAWSSLYAQHAAPEDASPRRVSAATTASALRIEGLAAWFGDQAGDAVLVLGKAAVGAPIDPVSRFVEAARASDGLAALVGALDALPALAFLTAEVAALQESTTYATDDEEVDVTLARRVQRPATEALRQSQYLTRLYLKSTRAVVDGLTPAERAALFVRASDFDADGKSSAAEVAAKLPGTSDGRTIGWDVATDPIEPDSDGDGALDGEDPCPNEADDGCFFRVAFTRDSDGDGVPDALDNCLNVDNGDQADASPVDGVGDACDVDAVILTPTVHPIARTGEVLRFSARLYGGASPRWTLGGLGADRTGLGPFDVPLTAAGSYRVSLYVTPVGGGPEVLADFRDVTVVGGPASVVTVTAEALTSAIEGQPVQLVASASTTAGTIVGVTWRFADASTATGASVTKVFASDGAQVIEVVATDSFGSQGTTTLTLSVGDTEPVVDFVVTVLDPFARVVSVQSTSTAYDGIKRQTFIWGDGDRTVGATAQHTYPYAGVFTITLRVRDTDGSVVKATKQVAFEDGAIEVVTATIGTAWQRVTFATPYPEAPVVVPAPLAWTGAVPLFARVRNVSATGFDIAVQAFGAAPTGTLQAAVLVARPGRRVYGDRSILEAGTFELSGDNDEFTDHVFASSWPRLPIVFAALQTAADPTAALARIGSLDEFGFEVAVTEQESLQTSGHARETVGWIALTGNANDGTILVQGQPQVFDARRTRVGNTERDAVGCNAVLVEDKTLDNEVKHLAEYAWFMRFIGRCFVQTYELRELDPFAVRLLP